MLRNIVCWKGGAPDLAQYSSAYEVQGKKCLCPLSITIHNALNKMI